MSAPNVMRWVLELYPTAEIIEAFSLLPELRGTIADLIAFIETEDISDDTVRGARKTLAAVDGLLSKVSGT